MHNNDDYSIEKEILESRGESNVEDLDATMIHARGIRKKKSYIEKVDKISSKNFRKRRAVLVFICVFVLSIAFIIGGSFALTSSTSETENTSSLEAGVMKLDFKEEGNAISMNNGLPQTNKDALANNSEYSFSLTNTGNVAAEYTLSLDNSCTTNQNYKIEGKTVRPDICIPDKYIKAAISVNGREYKVITRNEKEELFVLEKNVLEANKVNNYKLKIWMDINTPNNYNSKGTNNVVYSGVLNVLYKQVTSTLDNTNSTQQ